MNCEACKDIKHKHIKGNHEKGRLWRVPDFLPVRL